MGEYFKWANYDKRKVLSNDVWGEGVNLSDFVQQRSARNDAAATLLAGPWAGDRVILCGDEACFFDDDECKFRRSLAPLRPDDLPYDWDNDPECEAAGLFRAARGLSRRVWLYGRDAVTLPFEGPFSLEPRQVRYVVNETKKEYVDRLHGPVLKVSLGGVEREDLFPVLCCSRSTYGSNPEGRWFGDRLWASDERPSSSYRDITPCHEYRGEGTKLDDKEILDAYASSDAGESGMALEYGELQKFLRAVSAD